MAQHSSPRPADTLGMDPDEMRRLGYKVVDLVVEHFLNRDAGPAILTGDAETLRSKIGTELPEQPQDADQSIALLAEYVLAHQQHCDHPRYFARVPGPGSFAAVLGEWLGTGFNTIATSWAGGSGPATVELIVCEWLRQLLDLPSETEGVLVSGGSLANLTAFAIARSVCGQGIVYLTDQTHASLARDLKALGFAPGEIRILESDSNFRMSTAVLREAVEADRKAGRHPMMVAASAGTTNTGAVDPLPEIAELCRKHDMWFHLDGAFGAPAYFCEKGREALAGLTQCDSVVLDPHKWLFQPYDVGALLVTRSGALEQTFSMTPEYLKDTVAGNREVDFRNRSLELTRRSRALKLWLSMRIYGVDRLRAAIARGVELAEFAESCLRREPDTWEVLSPAQLGIVCFALRGATADDHVARAKRLADSGYACITTTTLKGRSALRLCIINNLTTEEDIRGTLDRLSGKVAC